MLSVQRLSTTTLFRRARKAGVLVRKVRNWRGLSGIDGYMPCEDSTGFALEFWPLDDSQIREWLVERLTD